MKIATHKNIYLLLLVFSCMLFTACGKKSDKEIYEDQMKEFYETVTNISQNIDYIDPESDTAVADLLSELDSMNDAFATLESIAVPKDYSENEQLGQKAAQSMNQSVTLYREAFGSEPFNSEISSQAKEYYDDAMNYASAMGKIMMGYEIESGD